MNFAPWAPTAKIELIAAQQKSLMPEMLLRDFTAEQVADLLEYLSSLKAELPPATNAPKSK